MKEQKTILALQLFLLLAALDQTVITTAMPKIIEQLGGFDRYAWATTGYLFTSTIAVPVAGKLSDQFGRKKSLLTAVLIFVLASLACGSAVSWSGFPVDGMNQLIIYRLVQGIGGGALVSLCFSVVADLFPPSKRGKYQGYFAAVFALASIIGPSVGGYVADVASWRWLFFINLPVGILGTILFCLTGEDNKVINTGLTDTGITDTGITDTGITDASLITANSFDWRGLVLFCLTSTSLLLALSLPIAAGPRAGGSLGLSSETSSALIANGSLFCLFALFLTIFLRVEAQVKNPFLPVALMRNKIILISIISLAVYGIGMFGASLMVPLYMQSVRGMSVSRSGIVLSPLILTVAIASILGGQWMSSSGKYKIIVLTGLTLMTSGIFVLASLKANAPLPILISVMAVVGLGIGIVLPVYTVVIQNAVSDELIGTVTGLSQFFRSIGGTLGVACLGSLLLYLYHSNLHQLIAPISLPPSVVSALENPLEPKKLRDSVTSAFSQAGVTDTALVATTVKTAQTALYCAINFVYLLYGSTLAATVMLNLLLEELPLRSTKSATSQEIPSPN